MQDFKFFQRKPLLITMDGYQIYPNESFVSVNKVELRNSKRTLPAFTVVERWPIPKKSAHLFKEDDTLVYFKYPKNAVKYVKLNKQSR